MWRAEVKLSAIEGRSMTTVSAYNRVIHDQVKCFFFIYLLFILLLTVSPEIIYRNTELCTSIQYGFGFILLLLFIIFIRLVWVWV